MRVCTIYWNEEQGNYHSLVSEVEENGSNKVISSNIYDNFLSATWTHQVVIDTFGPANVRFYMVKEVKDSK